MTSLNPSSNTNLLDTVDHDEVRVVYLTHRIKTQLRMVKLSPASDALTEANELFVKAFELVRSAIRQA